MSEQYPLTGVKRVIRPDGTVTRVEFHDAPTTPDERHALKKYDDLSPLEILRRLRSAEFNADSREQERDQWKAAAQRLERELAHTERKLAVFPPYGYTAPKVVVDLLAHAEAHGWRSVVSWSTPEGGGARMAMEIGRDTVPADGPTRGTKWRYQLAWGFPAPGATGARVRAGLAKTPDAPQWHDAPSVKKIRDVIAAHPTRQATES